MSNIQEKDIFQECADVCRRLSAAYERQEWSVVQGIIETNEWIVVKSREIRKSRAEENV